MVGMLVNFLGAPCSGKTTIAAMVFSMLKEQGISCEFIPEQARWHIAQKRVALGLSPTDNLSLDDEDQTAIMLKQFETEQILLSAVQDTAIVISDSSSLLSLLYMTPERLRNGSTRSLIQRVIARDCLYFYVKPVPFNGKLDPNRLHSQVQSLELDTKIDSLLQQEAPWVHSNLIQLQESSATRTRVAVSAILQKMFRNANSYSSNRS